MGAAWRLSIRACAHLHSVADSWMAGCKRCPLALRPAGVGLRYHSHQLQVELRHTAAGQGQRADLYWTAVAGLHHQRGQLCCCPGRMCERGEP